MGRQVFTFIENIVKAIGFYTSDLFTDFLGSYSSNAPKHKELL